MVPESVSYLVRLPVALVDGVLGPGAGVEAGEGSERVDARPAGAREGAHEAADRAQRGGDLHGHRGVRQQLRYQVTRLVDHGEVHHIPGQGPLAMGGGEANCSHQDASGPVLKVKPGAFVKPDKTLWGRFLVIYRETIKRTCFPGSVPGVYFTGSGRFF